jgi:selenocysteine lyase/cysteine desulfurase
VQLYHDLAPNYEDAGWDPVRIADALNVAGVESRAGCHYLYNTIEDVDLAANALASIVASRVA